MITNESAKISLMDINGESREEIVNISCIKETIDGLKEAFSSRKRLINVT